MKKLRIIPVMLATMLLTGCVKDRSVSNKRYLRAAVIGNDSVTFSFFSNEDDVVTVAADSPEKARYEAELSGGKEIFTGYTELIVLDGRNGADILDLMLNKWRVSPSCIVACCTEESGELLYERSAEELEGAVRIAQERELVGRCDIVSVLGGLLGERKSAEVPELSSSGFEGKRRIE